MVLVRPGAAHYYPVIGCSRQLASAKLCRLKERTEVGVVFVRLKQAEIAGTPLLRDSIGIDKKTLHILALVVPAPMKVGSFD